MDREVGLKAEEAFVGSGKTVQHSALVRRSASVSETQRGRRRARHHGSAQPTPLRRQPTRREREKSADAVLIIIILLSDVSQTGLNLAR